MSRPTPPGAARTPGSSILDPLRPYEGWIWGGAIFLAALWLFGSGIGDYPLWDPWEPKYAQAIEEMRERGDFVTPWFDERIRWTKPILIYWAMAVPVFLFGNTEWTVRLPSVIAAACAVLAVFGFVSRLRGRTAGVLAAGVLATIPQFFYMARQAMPDMLLTLWIATAMGTFALGRFADDGRRRLWFGLFYASLSLAFLTKGPVSTAIVGGALLVFWSIDADPRRFFLPRAVLADIRKAWSYYHVWLGIAVSAVITVPWYAAMLIRHGYTFIDRFVVDENLTRFSEPIRDHHGTAEFYLKDFFHGMYPWSGLLAVALPFAFFGLRNLDDEARQRWYWLSWPMWTFLLLSLAGTKMDHYILPLTPALAVLVALVLDAYLRDDAPTWIRPTLLLAAGFAALPIRDFLVEGDRNIFGVFNNARNIDYPGLPTALKLFLAGFCVALGLAYVLRRSRLAIALALLVSLGQAAYLGHVVLPAHTSQRTMKFYVDRWNAVREPDAVLVFYGKIRYSTHYYLGKRNYRHFEDSELAGLVDYVRDKPHVYFIVRTSDMGQLALQLRNQLRMRLYSLDTEHPRYHLLTNVPPAPREP